MDIENLLAKNQARADVGIRQPWWELATPDELQLGISRLRRALQFCRGRAADLWPHLACHILALESFAGGRSYTLPAEGLENIRRRAKFTGAGKARPGFDVAAIHPGLFDDPEVWPGKPVVPDRFDGAPGALMPADPVAGPYPAHAYVYQPGFGWTNPSK